MARGGVVFFAIALAVSGCQRGRAAPDNGYVAVDPAAAKRQTAILDRWRDCIIYGIGQIDTPKSSATEVAEAALAGCSRGQTALADEMFRDMDVGQDDPRMVRMAADSAVKDIAGQIHDTAIRWVLQKRREEAAHQKAVKR